MGKRRRRPRYVQVAREVWIHLRRRVSRAPHHRICRRHVRFSASTSTPPTPPTRSSSRRPASGVSRCISEAPPRSTPTTTSPHRNTIPGFGTFAKNTGRMKASSRVSPNRALPVLRSSSTTAKDRALVFASLGVVEIGTSACVAVRAKPERLCFGLSVGVGRP